MLWYKPITLSFHSTSAGLNSLISKTKGWTKLISEIISSPNPYVIMSITLSHYKLSNKQWNYMLIIFHLAIIPITTSKNVWTFLIKMFCKDVVHHALISSWGFCGKIIVLCLIIRNSPASLFNLKGTMIHTTDDISSPALTEGNLRISYSPLTNGTGS